MKVKNTDFYRSHSWDEAERIAALRQREFCASVCSHRLIQAGKRVIQTQAEYEACDDYWKSITNVPHSWHRFTKWSIAVVFVLTVSYCVARAFGWMS